MDYTELRDLLADRNWYAADEMTKAIMLTIANREAEGYLRASDIEKFPASELVAIDRLWTEASEGRFGLSVQQRIWHEVCENYTDFGDRVGWHRAGSWICDDQVNYTSEAPKGHLPAMLFPSPISGGDRVCSFVLGKWRSVLLSRHDLPAARANLIAS